MSVECFVDTNILVYAVSGAADEAAKRARAFEILENESFGLSGQVLQEFFVTLTRKARLKVSYAKALSWIEQFEAAPCVPVDYQLVRSGIGYSDRYKISYWDGALIAAAEELGASKLYTEDLNDGQSYGPVMVVNPFRGI